MANHSQEGLAEVSISQTQGRVDLGFVFSQTLLGVRGGFSSLPVTLVISILHLLFSCQRACSL